MGGSADPIGNIINEGIDSAFGSDVLAVVNPISNDGILGDAFNVIDDNIIHPVWDWVNDVSNKIVYEIGDFFGSKMIKDFAVGGHTLNEAIGNRNAKAAIMGGVLVLSVYMAWNPYMLANGVGSVVALNQAAAVILIGAGMAYSMYALYSIAMSVSDIGRALRSGANLYTLVGQMKDALNLLYVNAFINGSMNLWMAGGILYDAPRAGDLKFEAGKGRLDTTVFYGGQNSNDQTWGNWVKGSNGDYHKRTFNNLGGNPFFSISPQVARALA